jgi:hypothetical protein
MLPGSNRASDIISPSLTMPCLWFRVTQVVRLLQAKDFIKLTAGFRRSPEQRGRRLQLQLHL